MLSLTRRVIGNDIVIKVVGTEGSGKVGIGIDTPQSVTVLKEEVLEKVQTDAPDFR